MKADKQNKKKFNEVRKMVNKEQQSKEFGQLVDLRASDPVKVKSMVQNNKKKEKEESLKKKKSSEIRNLKRGSTLQRLNDNYFYKNFETTD